MKNKILLVDDNQDVLDTHIKNLNDLAHEMVSVTDFVQLKTLLETDSSDFFIALHDHVFSEDRDNQSLSLLMQSHIPTIVFAQEYDDNIRETTIAHGALDYVVYNDGVDYVYIAQMIERAYKNQMIKAVVADGNASARQEQVELLKKFNIDAFEAKNYAEISSLLASSDDIDLLIVDQSLEKEKGTDVIHDIRKTYYKDNLSIIGVTEHGHSSRLAVEFLKKGANDFISKPFISEEFNLRVLQSLDTLEFIKTNKQSSMVDHLTQMYNKRAFESLGLEVCSKAKKEAVAVSCAMLDIDFFKKINDNYGHHIGDKVLVAVANLFKKHFRKNDLVARVGGEEFVILLSNIEQDKCLEILEIYRKKLEDLIIVTDSGEIRITVSIGLYSHHEYRLEVLMQKADLLLYEAKEGGRNQIVAAS